MTSLIVFAVLYGVLSSAHLAKLVLFIMKNRSPRKMLHNKGPRLDPCGIPNKISFQGLHSKFTFVLKLLSNYESASLLQC